MRSLSSRSVCNRNDEALRSVNSLPALCSGFKAIVLIGLLTVLASPLASAQDGYPAKPIRIIVPTAPGGPSDLGSRMIGEHLQKRWGKPVIVETRPGAGTIVGVRSLRRRPPTVTRC